MMIKLAYTEPRQRLGELCLRVLDRDALHVDGNELVEERLRTLALTIAAGTSQIQRNIIGERVLGLPKEPQLDGLRAHRRPGRAPRRHRVAARRRVPDRARPRGFDRAMSTSSPRPACSRCGPTASRGPTRRRVRGARPRCVPGPLVCVAARSATAASPAGSRTPAAWVEHLDALDVVVVPGTRRRASTRRGRRASRRRGRSIRDAGRARRRRSRPATTDRRSTGAEWQRAGAVLTAALPPRARRPAAPSSSVAYAKEREQFDRPIGSFQAVKHLCADMLVRTEVARAAVYAAGAAPRRRPDARGVDRAVTRREGARRRGRDRERQVGNAGARRHGLHVGGRRAPLPEAGLGARHPLRLGDEHADAVAARAAEYLSYCQPRCPAADHRARSARAAPCVRPRRPVSRFRRGRTAVYGAAMDKESTRLAHTFSRARAGTRRSVATLLDNRAEQVVSFFAALKLGAVQVPINTAYKGEFLRHQLADSGARVFIVPGRLRVARGRGGRVRRDSRAHPLRHGRSPRRGDRRGAGDPLGTTRCAWEADPSTTAVRPSDLACLIYTAGTTGPSKGCMLPHNYIASLADQIRAPGTASPTTSSSPRCRSSTSTRSRSASSARCSPAGAQRSSSASR